MDERTLRGCMELGWNPSHERPRPDSLGSTEESFPPAPLLQVPMPSWPLLRPLMDCLQVLVMGLGQRVGKVSWE